MSDDHELMTSILDWFGEIEQWIPGAHSMVGEIILGPIPLSDANQVYDLADQWGRLAEALGAAYEDVLNAADPILQSWSGDGAAAQFVSQWYAYLEGLRSTAESAAAMQQGVQSFGLQVELMKFMALLNLIMLAVSLFLLIAAAIPTGGGSLGAAPGLFAACRLAIGAAADKTVATIAGIIVRTVLKRLSTVVARTVAAGGRALAPAALKAAVPRVRGINFARAVAAAGARGGLPAIARTVAARGISRSVANRLAAQALRGQAARQLGGTLAGQTTRALRAQLAREIEEQLARKFTTGAVSRVAGETSEAVLKRFAAERAAQAGLGRELTRFVGTRVAFGAGFMGGGSLLGQFGQVVSGNRADVAWGDVLRGTLEGAAFGAGMYGGPLGHVVGGAAAGSLVAAGHEAYEYATSDDPAKREFDWAKVGHGAVQGAAAGVIFGSQTHLETSRAGGGGLRIGQEIHVLPGEQGGLTVTATRGGESLVLTDSGYVAFRGADGSIHLPDGVTDRAHLDAAIAQHWPAGADRTAEAPPPPAAARTPADPPPPPPCAAVQAGDAGAGKPQAAKKNGGPAPPG